MSAEHDQNHPVLIIGAGLAGLTVALHIADRQPVILMAKRRLNEAATAWAQGGIVGVLDQDDSIDSHVADTVTAGAGLVVESVSRYVAENSAEAIHWLVDQGVPFTPDVFGPEGLHLTREGGHTHRRIAHAADATGKAIHDVLLDKAQAHPNIKILENWIALDLITNKHLQTVTKYKSNRCYGAYALDIENNRVETILAKAVVLATGGVGKVYRYTSNPDTATGDGIAMAWRAGCRIGNMEFIQFHPTGLYSKNASVYLITEALRGAGAVLRNHAGENFMPRYDKRGSLAPRDIVARAIDSEMKKSGDDFVYLDTRHIPKHDLLKHFPNISRFSYFSLGPLHFVHKHEKCF